MCFSTVSLACYVWCVLFRRDRLPIGREYSKPIQRINFIVSCRCRCYNYSLWVFGKSGLIFFELRKSPFCWGKIAAIDSERWDVQDFIHVAWPGNRNARFLCAWPLLSRRGEVSTLRERRCRGRCREAMGCWREAMCQFKTTHQKRWP